MTSPVTDHNPPREREERFLGAKGAARKFILERCDQLRAEIRQRSGEEHAARGVGIYDEGEQ